MIYVVATIEVQPGKREEFLAVQRDLLPLVLAEEGCIEYTPTIDVAMGNPAKSPLRENVVVMQEKWETIESLRAHSVAPHMNAFRTQAKELIVSIKVEVFETLK